MDRAWLLKLKLYILNFITGLEKINDEHLICGLWNGAVHLISVKTGLLTVDAIEKDISYANYCCQGLALSRNGAFAVLCNR